MIPSKEVKTLLTNGGVTTAIYRYVMPSEEDSGIECILLTEVGGPGNDGDMGFSLLQVLTRCSNPDTGYARLVTIQGILETFTGDTNFAGFTTESDIMYLSRDLNSRDLFSISFIVMKQTI